MNEWISVADEAPPNGLVVDTKIDDEHGPRNEQPLCRQGNLWFFPDGGMYVYYYPTHWRKTDRGGPFKDCRDDWQGPGPTGPATKKRAADMRRPPFARDEDRQ